MRLTIVGDSHRRAWSESGESSVTAVLEGSVVSVLDDSAGERGARTRLFVGDREGVSRELAEDGARIVEDLERLITRVDELGGDMKVVNPIDGGGTCIVKSGPPPVSMLTSPTHRRP
jgi:hypothetical protein